MVYSNKMLFLVGGDDDDGGGGKHSVFGLNYNKMIALSFAMNTRLQWILLMRVKYFWLKIDVRPKQFHTYSQRSLIFQYRNDSSPMHPLADLTLWKIAQNNSFSFIKSVPYILIQSSSFHKTLRAFERSLYDYWCIFLIPNVVLLLPLHNGVHILDWMPSLWNNNQKYILMAYLCEMFSHRTLSKLPSKCVNY